MSSTDYIAFPLDSEPENLISDAIAYIQTQIPGWQPRDGNLDTIMLEALAAMASDVRFVASQVPTTIFRYMGATLMGVQPIDATPAMVTSTWQAIDASGHTVEAGTQVGILDSLGGLIPFYVQSDVVIPSGSVATAAGQVVLIAVNPGEDGNALGVAGTLIQLIDVKDWVFSIALTNTTANGQDAETDDAYLNRLRRRLQLLTPRPIKPADFAALALDIAGVGFAIAIDGYDPATATSNNARTVAVALMDEDGHAVAAAVKSAVQTYLTALREVNFVVNAIDPTFVLIDVTYQVAALPGTDETALVTSVNAAIRAYLSPTFWASLQESGGDATKVRYLELAQVINAVSGVDYVVSATFAVHGNSLATTDVTLSGVAPLPVANTLTGTTT